MIRIEHKGAHGDGSNVFATSLFEHELDKHPEQTNSEYQTLVNKLKRYSGTGSVIVTGGDCARCVSVASVVGRNPRVGPFS